MIKKITISLTALVLLVGATLPVAAFSGDTLTSKVVVKNKTKAYANTGKNIQIGGGVNIAGLTGGIGQASHLSQTVDTYDAINKTDNDNTVCVEETGGNLWVGDEAHSKVKIQNKTKSSANTGKNVQVGVGVNAGIMSGGVGQENHTTQLISTGNAVNEVSNTTVVYVKTDL